MNHLVSRTRLWKLLGAVCLLALLTLLGVRPALADGSCVDDVTGRTNTCSADDVVITDLRNLISVNCYEGWPMVLSLKATLEGAAERYDLGFFFALDGGDADSGTCLHDYLHPISTSGTCSTSGTFCSKDDQCPTGETCVKTYSPDGGPFLDAEPADADDICADLEQSVVTTYQLPPLVVDCKDSDGDGYLDIGTALTWDDQKTRTCADGDGAVPSAPDLCRYQMLNVSNVTVVPGALQIAKSPAPAELPEPGGPVVFTFRAQNTSETRISVEELVDSVYGPLDEFPGSDCTVPQTLEAGEAYTCTITADVTGGPGVHKNTVTASGRYWYGLPLDDSATAEVLIVGAPPALSVTKEVDPATVQEPGGTVKYTVKVGNGSGASDPVTLTGLADNLYGDLTDDGNPLIKDSTCDLVAIQPGQDYTCTFEADVSGSGGQTIADTVTATGTDDDGAQAQATDDALVTIVAVPPDAGVGVPALLLSGGALVAGLALARGGAALRRKRR